MPARTTNRPAGDGEMRMTLIGTGASVLGSNASKLLCSRSGAQFVDRARDGAISLLCQFLLYFLLDAQILHANCGRRPVESMRRRQPVAQRLKGWQ